MPEETPLTPVLSSYVQQLLNAIPQNATDRKSEVTCTVHAILVIVFSSFYGISAEKNYLSSIELLSLFCTPYFMNTNIYSNRAEKSFGQYICNNGFQTKAAVLPSVFKLVKYDL